MSSRISSQTGIFRKFSFYIYRIFYIWAVKGERWLGKNACAKCMLISPKKTGARSAQARSAAKTYLCKHSRKHIKKATKAALWYSCFKAYLYHILCTGDPYYVLYTALLIS
jgi:hypothetical protein